jgi:lipoprotein NlpD
MIASALGRSSFVSSALLALAILAGGCASHPAAPPATYTVKRGDTLYAIATRFGLDFREVARRNRIGGDYRIEPGQVLTLGRSATAARNPIVPAPRSAEILDPSPAWNWPTQGGTVSSTERPNGGQGLTISGRAGQDVKAAADGKIVYTGAGLLGYGQLVIIKHNETYLSAYGHTEALNIKEGDAVKAGQTIATMGNGPSGSPMLYFEIRVHGRPINPLSLLPRQ